MGVTIHYGGKLKEASELQSLIEEVRDIALEKGWNHFVFENKFENDQFTIAPDLDTLFGIMITPKDSEPMCFSFLSDGRMCGIINFNVITINNAIDEDLAFSLFTKTQYAGFEIHKQLIVLLDHISTKYFVDFKCSDEGQYWETRDEDLLKETFKRFGSFIDSFASSLEMIPPNENENIEDFILRIADSTNSRVNKMDDEMPELSIEDENKFKRMKLELEHDANFSTINPDIPPEIESMFLDNVMQFENQFKNAKQITILEKIGNPKFAKSEHLTSEQLERELEQVFNLLAQHNIILDVLYDYENESKLLYDFITLEFLNHETDDISILGLMSHFIYEEFYPNHYEDLKKDCIEFWTRFLGEKNEHFDEFTLGDLENSDELIDFRDAFKLFKNVTIDIERIEINLEEAKGIVTAKLNFKGVVDVQNKINFSCKTLMRFIYQYEYWYLKEAEIPMFKGLE